MPEKRVVQRARRKAREGKSASTVAGEFVRNEIEEVRRGEHGARNVKQAIAIGLSKARRAGVPVGRKGAKRRKADARRIHVPRVRSRKRSQAARRALKREPHRTVSRRALSRHARKAARA
jgi:hypothetical protein